jgi:diacylglycerol kinase family enzyme
MNTTSVHESSTGAPDSGVADEPAPEPTRPSGRIRAAMIINPYSSGMTAKRELAIVQTLREHMDVEVRRTERAGHAPKLARELMEAGELDVIISCGGDGTANEILNGMDLAEDTAEQRPAFAIVPAGGTNVLARSVGYANHPVKATEQLAQAIVERRTRTINLATVDERIFMFAAGVGLDGEVVKRVEQRRSGRRPSDLAHLAIITGYFATKRFALGEQMTVTVGDTGEQLRAALVVVGNTTPMTYLGGMPVVFMPDCALEKGLDVMAPTRASAFFTILNGMQAVGVGRKNRRLVKDDRMNLRHDVKSVLVECDEPMAVQVDGEYIGDRTHIQFGLLERTIRLVA